MAETILARRTSNPIVFANAADLIPGIVAGTAGVGIASDLRDYIQANLVTPIIAAAANTEALAVTGYSLTGSDATSMIDLAGTWNTTGTPTAVSVISSLIAVGTPVVFHVPAKSNMLVASLPVRL